MAIQRIYNRMVLSKIAPIFLIVGLVSCGGGSAEIKKREKEEVAMEPMTVDEAESVYITNCESCHGMDGKKGLSGAADLSLSVKSDAELLNVIRNGNDKGMMPYKDMLTDREQKGLVEFVKSLKK